MSSSPPSAKSASANPPGSLKASLLILVGVSLALNSGPVAIVNAQPGERDPLTNTNVRKDDPLARLKALRESWGEVSPEAARHVLKEAAGQRKQHPERTSPSVPAEAATAQTVPVWKSIGPTSALVESDVAVNAVDSGRVRTILPHPTDANIVYVLSSGGGLWKTNNFLSSNTTWTAKTDFIGSTSGGSVAFGRVPDTLYLGTGDPFDVQPGGFMLKSTDGGNNWSSPIFLSGATQVLDIKIDSSGPSDIVLVGTNNGLFRSTDAGNSYTQVASLSFGSNRVWSVVQSSAGWLASSQGPDIQTGFFDGATSLYLSTDHGASWAVTGSGFSSAATRTTLAVGDAGDNIVYALAGSFDSGTSTDSQLDLFRSIDGGRSWTALGVNSGKAPTNPNSDQPDMNLLSVQARYNQMLLVDPTDATRNTVYLGGELSSAKTIDGGTTWTLLTNWLARFGLGYIHCDMQTAAFSKLGNVTFVGSDGGICVSNDQGATWINSKNTGLVDQLLYSIISGVAHPEQVLIGLQDDGISFRIGNSTVYNQVLTGDGLGVGWSQANDNVSIGALQDGDFRVSHFNPPVDHSNFIAGRTGLSGSIPFETPLTTPTGLSDPTGNNFFTHSDVAIFKGLNVTRPVAFRWTNIFETNVGFTFQGRHAIGVGPNLQHIGVAGTGGNVLITTTGFSDWSTANLQTEVPGYGRGNSNVTWANATTIYVTSVSPVVPPPVHVAKSTNTGAPGSWVAADNGLPAVPVERLLVDPRDGTGESLYAATLLGVYYTTDGGANWQLFGTGLPQVRVTDLYVSPDGGTLRAATYGRGAWEISTSIPSGLGNISTRLHVGTGDNVLIGGIIVTGSQNKKIIVRAVGPSLPLAEKLADPILELHDGSGALLETNDNWVDSPNKQAIIDSTIPPTNDLESAIVRIMAPGAYTAIVRGVSNGTGIGVVEAYNLDPGANSKLANISTRGLVQTGDNVLIAGTIVVGQASKKVIVRAIGPSLTVPGRLADPTLELHDGSGTTIATNDNWRFRPDGSSQEAEIIATTIPPTNDLESAIVATLPANNAQYTAIVRGVGSTTGIAVVEVYGLD